MVKVAFPAVADQVYCKWFKDLTLEDIALVGGKNASLGEMQHQLDPLGIKIPYGFAVTSEAFKETVRQAGAHKELEGLLVNVDKTDSKALSRVGARAREIIFGATMPEKVEEQIRQAYRDLKASVPSDDAMSVAVRSSATAEDLPTASFAGQHDTFLNISGEEMLIDAVKRCQASLFTDRAISYRIDNGFDHMKVFLSVGVQRMVRSDLASAGVIFTLDTESGHPGVVFTTGSWGLGENVVAGTVDPDEWYVHKPTFKQGFRSVFRKVLGKKQVKMLYATGHLREQTLNRPTPKADRRRFCLSDDEVLELADAAIKIEDHYSSLVGKKRAMDLEWAKDGKTGELFIVQARPETVISQRSSSQITEYFLDNDSNATVLTTGRAVGTKIASGNVKKVMSPSDLTSFNSGDVLVADTTTPDWNPIMKRAAGIVTNRGGRTCHAAIVARELDIPTVVGTENGTEVLDDGSVVTISCTEGSVGKIYEGAVPFHKLDHNLELTHPRTKIMVNLGNPELAFQTSMMECDGVGLARMEFIITNAIKVHPMAALYPERVESARERSRIKKIIQGYPDGGSYYVEKLSRAIGTIAAAFYPRPVIVRLSDFKSNEYAALVGGKDFEPHEENPMLGFRGAARYTHPNFAEAFALEVEALRRVREVMGLKNLKVMVPFCRRIDEAKKVLAAMQKHGLKRGQDGLEVYVMCEVSLLVGGVFVAGLPLHAALPSSSTLWVDTEQCSSS